MQKKDTIKRYILFQIPEFLLTVFILYTIQYFYEYPSWIIWIVLTFSICKDAVLFNYTWKSYIIHKKEDFAGVKGKHCTATSDFKKTGFVALNGELWKVEVEHSVKKGDELIITGIRGLILVAEKIH